MLNLGVEAGPMALLDDQLAAALELQPHLFTFSEPSQPNRDEYLRVFAQQTADYAAQMTDILSDHHTLPLVSVALGGDHSVSLAHVAALFKSGIQSQRTGILMIDSHADINSVGSSPTGNAHGMWLRPIISRFDLPGIDALVPQKVTPTNLRYIGNLDLDPAEAEYIHQQGISTTSVDQLRQHKTEVLQSLTEWFGSLDHLHVSIDIDAFDKSIAPATGIPCPAGLLESDVSELFSAIQRLPHWSLDLVEVNPQKTGATETIELARKILTMLIKK